MEPTRGDRLKALAADLGISLPALAVSWTLAHPAVDVAIVVTVWNRTSATTQPLVDRGAWAADTPAAVAGSDAVLTILANPGRWTGCCTATTDCSARCVAGSCSSTCPTVGQPEISSVARRLPSQVTLIDAPMRGSVPEGTAGRLAIFVGATAADFEGGPGAGAATKLVVNLTLGVAITALGKTLARGDTLGARPRERSQ